HYYYFSCFYFFFFQAEDGIRDDLVTGVQTCALPICMAAPIVPIGEELAIGRMFHLDDPSRRRRSRDIAVSFSSRRLPGLLCRRRSEERRVGKEGRCGGGLGSCKKRRRVAIESHEYTL